MKCVNSAEVQGREAEELGEGGIGVRMLEVQAVGNNGILALEEKCSARERR